MRTILTFVHSDGEGRS